MEDRNLSSEMIGRKIIENAVNLDESLAEILRMEVKKMKQLTKACNTPEEILKTNNILKSIIIALIITDEKIRTGIDLCFDNLHK